MSINKNDRVEPELEMIFELIDELSMVTSIENREKGYYYGEGGKKIKINSQLKKLKKLIDKIL